VSEYFEGGCVVDFAWTEEQKELRQRVIEFARAELVADVVERDHSEAFSNDGWRRCANVGIHSIPLPKELGGKGQGILSTVCALEALGYACRDTGLLFALAAHMCGVQVPIMIFGTQLQQDKYLPRLTNGDWIGALAMTEPESGSDAYSLRTRAVRERNRYILNGTKTFVTNAPCAQIMVVFARVEARRGRRGITAFVIEKDMPGVAVGNPIHKMGLRTAPMADVRFLDCAVPVQNIIGTEGQGGAIFLTAMEWERICIVASHLGVMQRLLETSVRYARDRKQFGQPIGKFQAISHKLAEMDVRLETARLALYKAAWLKQQGKHPTREIAIAKLYVTEAAQRSCLDAVQIRGAHGYVTECEVERDLRDAIAGTIYSGTSEIQKVIIASLLGL
jgi:alkylation response protein AidB-like acyl-CoA dehydrogenase